MIVDDEDMLHELYGELLKLKGYQVVASAFNGVEAVDKYRQMEQRPDLVLMDHRMPVKNGLEAMKEILDIDSGAQVVFLTADAAVAEHALAAGAADILLKPFRIDVLHKTVADVATKVGK
jgi:two-component system chemotaxis response regulator CheY